MASVSASEWFGGANKDPVTMSMDPKKRSSSVGSAGVPGLDVSKSRQEVEAELKAAKYKLRVLKAECELYKKQLEG